MAKQREAAIVSQIREVLRLLRIPHFKHWGGPFSERGVPDLIAVIPPAGRLLLIEVKVPKGVVSPDQDAFLSRWGAAGAVAMVARDPRDVVRELISAGYEKAKMMGEIWPAKP